MKANGLAFLTEIDYIPLTSALAGSAIVLGLCFGQGIARAQTYTQENEQLEFAAQLLQQAQYQSAAMSYEDFIRQFPRSSLLPNAYVGAGDSHFFLKEPEKAMEYYQQYESQFPNGKEKWLVFLREAQCLYLDGKAKEAVSKLTSINTGSIQAPFKQTYYFYLAKAQMDSGNIKDAAESFEKVIEQKSTGEYATMSLLQLASILEHAGDGKDAAQLYDTAMQSGDSIEIRSQIELMQAMSLMQAKQYDMAALAFEKIADGYPTLPAGKDAAVNWFIALLKSNQSEEAVSDYNNRFKDNFDDPLYGPIHLLAADAMLIQKQNDEAMEILNTLISAPVISQKVKNNAAYLKSKIIANNGHFDDVLQLLNNQSPSESNCSQARDKFSQGQFAQSGSLFLECFNKDTDETYRQDDLYSAFMMFVKANKLDESEKTSKLYQAHYPKGAHYYEIAFNLAGLYSQNKEYGQAVDLLKTVANSPSLQYQREALFQTAYNLQLEGKGREALPLYGVIINQNTDTQLTLMSLKNSALIYSENNDQDNAAEAMDKIVLNYPDNDLPTIDYLWLIEYWLHKKDPQRMHNVLDAVQKRTASGEEGLGIKYFTAEAFRLENKCSQAVPIYESINATANNPYQERSRSGFSLCQKNSDQNIKSEKAPSGPEKLERDVK